MPDRLTPEKRALLKGWTVGDLIDALQRHPRDLPVIVYGEHGQDGESPACDLAPIWYRPVSTWGGEVHALTDSDGEPYKPDQTREVQAVFIEPTN